MTEGMDELAAGSAELQTAMRALRTAISEPGRTGFRCSGRCGGPDRRFESLTAAPGSVLAALSALEAGAEDLTVSTASPKTLQIFVGGCFKGPDRSGNRIAGAVRPDQPGGV